MSLGGTPSRLVAPVPRPERCRMALHPVAPYPLHCARLDPTPTAPMYCSKITCRGSRNATRQDNAGEWHGPPLEGQCSLSGSMSSDCLCPLDEPAMNVRKMSGQAPAGAQENSRVADPAAREGKRSAAPGNGEMYPSPGRGDRKVAAAIVSVAPSGLLTYYPPIPGPRFACPGLFSLRRSAASSRFICNSYVAK